MTYFLNTYWIIVLILILIFDIYCLHTLITSRFGHYAPFAPTLGSQKKFIIKEIGEILNKSSFPLTVMDAGCGNGSLLKKLALKFPQHQFIGIEWSFPLYKYCLLSSEKLENLTFVHQDMFKYPFNQADIIICFLIPQMAEQFGNKTLKEIKQECRIFSNGLKFADLKLVKESPQFKGVFRQKVYIFQKP